MKVKDSSTIAEIKLLGYQVKFQPRKGRRGGGVCALYKKHINLKKCNVTQYKTFEVMEAVISNNNDLLRVSTFYRTGKMSTEGRSNFINDLDDYLLSIVQKNGEKMLCGDFNIHVQNANDIDTKALFSVTESYGFQLLIHGPTHRDGATLDLIFVHDESKIAHTVELSLLIYDLTFSLTSDHCFIECNIPFDCALPHETKINISYREFDKVNANDFVADTVRTLSELSNDFFAEDVNTAAALLNDALQQAIDQHAPFIDASVKPKRTCFTNDDITLLRRKRRKAEKMFRKFHNPADKYDYEQLVKQVKQSVTKSMNDYIHKNLEESCNDSKKKFKVFNKLLGKDQEQHLPSYENDELLCKDFESFFCSKIENIAPILSYKPIRS